MGNNASQCSCESTGGDADPVFSVMASKDLQEFYGRVTSDLGVKTVQNLSLLMDADLDRIGMKPVQKQLLKELVAEIRAYGPLTDNDDQNNLNDDFTRGTAKLDELSTLSGTELRAQTKPVGAGVQQKAPASASDNTVQVDVADNNEETAEAEVADVALRAELRAELGKLNLKQLRERALAAGVSGDVVEGARDADDPKVALIELLVARHADTVDADSSAEGLMLAISAGG